MELQSTLAPKALDEADAPSPKAFREMVAEARRAIDEAVTEAEKALIKKRERKIDEGIAMLRKAYGEGAVPSQKDLDGDVAEVREAYDEAEATARKALDEWVSAMWNIFDEIVTIAQKAYDEADDPTRKALYEALYERVTFVRNHTLEAIRLNFLT